VKREIADFRWLLVDQLRAARFQLRERRVDVLDTQRDVVQPGAALLDVLRDRRFGSGRLEQFEAGLADRHEMRAHVLRRDVLGRLDLEPERVAVERGRGRQILHRDADVIEDRLHFNDRPARNSRKHETHERS